MRVLVTGATGFLGSHLCRRLHREGHDVRALVRVTSDRSPLAGLPVEVFAGDIAELESVRRAVRGCDWVIHAAASLSYWSGDRARQKRVNEEGTCVVARACRAEAVARLLHVSSVAAVGIPTDPRRPADEGFPFNLEERHLPYHASKRRAEEVVLEEVSRGLDAVIVNPASLFGPFRAGYRGAEMMAKVRRTRIVPYFTGGLCVVHVDDVVAGAIAALERGGAGERYILGGENLTFRKLAERTAAAMGLPRRLVPVPSVVTGLAASALEPWGRWRNRRPRITRAVHYCASRFQFYDSGLARRVLGFAPRPFAAILDECLRLGAC